MGAEESIEISGDSDRLADGDDARAANAGHQQTKAFVYLGQDRLGDRRQILAPGRCRLGLAQAAAVHGHEARAKSLDAGEILVTARLVDTPLAPEFRFQGLDRHAIGHAPAISAAFADLRIDEGALGRVGPFAALAKAPALGRAGLLV